MKLRTRLTLSSSIITIVVITIMLIILELGIDDLTILNIRTSNQGIRFDDVTVMVLKRD